MRAFAARNAKIGGGIEHALMREEMAKLAEKPRATKRRGKHPRKALTDAGYGLVSPAENGRGSVVLEVDCSTEVRGGELGAGTRYNPRSRGRRARRASGCARGTRRSALAC